MDDSERAFKGEYQRLHARQLVVAGDYATGLATEDEYNEAFLAVHKLATARARQLATARARQLGEPELDVPSFEFVP